MTTSVTGQLPGTDQVSSWLDGIRQKFLALPARMTADLKALAYLQGLNPTGANASALTLAGQQLLQAQGAWGNDASKYQAIEDEFASKTASASTLVTGVQLAGDIAYLFYQVEAAETQLNSVAASMLSPQQYTDYQNIAGSTGGLGGLTKTEGVVAGVGIAALLYIFLR